MALRAHIESERVMALPCAESALARQGDELQALAAMYGSGQDEGEELTIEETATGELACTLTLLVHRVLASLSITLPRLYPTSVPPRLTVSVPALRCGSSLAKELDKIAKAGVEDDREVLFEVCQTFQERATQLLESQHAVQAVQSVHADTQSAVRDAAGGMEEDEATPRLMVAAVWFHHIKSQEKRKHIVGWARNASLRGFSKPGFPGVVVAEGEAALLADYLARLRELRWQAMEVRWLAERADDAPRLCEPFVELPESAMGEAAALCEDAGLLAEFRTAVLKLPSRPA